MKPCLVLTTLPDVAAADALAAQLVEARLAACVSRLAPCQSTYRWQGNVEVAEEVPLLIKTTEAHYAALEALISKAHPYDVPELVVLPITQGLPAYLSWILEETQS